MPHVRTHYDNLKVSRDAPIEVIRAAHKALLIKYHPDSHPGNEEAARITRIINRSYDVLSDPAARLEHDHWIASEESESFEFVPPVIPPRQVPPPSPLKRWLGKHWLTLVAGIFIIAIIVGVLFSGFPNT
jgi:curved DNA-binding protein CbpA